MGCCTSVDVSNRYESMSVGKADIRPFDLIFFRGTGPISASVSWAQNKVLGNGDWSHVGMVISKRYLPLIHGIDNLGDDELFLWESGISSTIYPADSLAAVPDVETKHTIVGVQIRPLSKLLEFSGPGHEIGWSRLSVNPIDYLPKESHGEYAERMMWIKATLAGVHKRYFTTEYQSNPCYLSVFCPCACCRAIQSIDIIGNDKLICSQFVTIIYQALTIIPDTYDAAEILPMEFVDPKLRSKIGVGRSGIPLITRPVILVNPKVELKP